MEAQKQAEIKAKIARLRESYARLKAVCSYGARINAETLAAYAKEAAALQAELKE
jgi:hypothetical protein